MQLIGNKIETILERCRSRMMVNVYPLTGSEITVSFVEK